MDPAKIRHRYEQLKKNPHITKAFRKGYLSGLLTVTKNMPEGAFTGLMEECLGENWVQELEDHDLIGEGQDQKHNEDVQEV